MTTFAMSPTFPTVTEYCGPERLYRNSNGNVVIEIHHRPDCYDQGDLMLRAAWVATALGWYRVTNLVGEATSRDTLEAYCRERFPHCDLTIAQELDHADH